MERLRNQSASGVVCKQMVHFDTESQWTLKGIGCYGQSDRYSSHNLRT